MTQETDQTPAKKVRIDQTPEHLPHELKSKIHVRSEVVVKHLQYIAELLEKLVDKDAPKD